MLRKLSASSYYYTAALLMKTNTIQGRITRPLVAACLDSHLQVKYLDIKEISKNKGKQSAQALNGQT
jgi:hypothetical protein